MYDKKVGFVCPLHLHVLGFCKRAYLAIKEVVFIVTQYAVCSSQITTPNKLNCIF